ncbi:MAG: UDP-2,3-diacylglucosamine diphosphatase [Maritimibacter sp.]
MLPFTANPTAPKSCRAVFLSDFHLGARACQPKPIVEFLRRINADTIYLVGDILDLWHGGQLYWGAEHDAVIAELDRHYRLGTRIVYLPGNHDTDMRRPDAVPPFAHTEKREALVHLTAEGKRYLVLHGDQCDSRLMRWHFMTRIGSRVDSLVRRIDTAINQFLGEERFERSLSERLIGQFNSLMLGDRFETRLARLAEATGTDGVICGHSHKPTLRKVGDTQFANSGDWVDSLTALIEEHDGALKLYEFAPETAPRPAPVAEPFATPVTATVSVEQA